MRSLAECRDPLALVPGDVGQIRYAAQQIRERADSCEQIGLEVQRTDLTSWWEGRAAEAAAGKIHEMARTYCEITNAHSKAAQALEEYGHALEYAQSQAVRAVEAWLAGLAATAQAEATHARALEKQVEQFSAFGGGGGRGLSRSVSVPVGYTPQAVAFVDTGAPLREEAVALLAQARQGLASSGRAVAASVEAATAMLPTRSVWAGLSTASSTDGSRSGGTSPPRYTTNPQDNLDWWNSLPLYERRTYIEAFPERIGNMDGIPAAVRDEANRCALARDERMLREELEYYTAVANGQPIPAHLKYWNYHYTEADTAAAPAKVAAINSNLDRLEKIKEAVSGPDRALLIYEPGSTPPRAAVAIGDVDTADHVAVLVPGTGANVTDDIRKMSTQAKSLREAAIRQLKGEGTVATVAWIDYAAPTNLFWAALPHSSSSASTELASFTKGLDVTHVDAHGNPADVHLTVGGHSYGATVVGKASALASSGIDDVIVYGAPGVGANPAAGVGRYSMLNEDDLIRFSHVTAPLINLTPTHGAVPYDWEDPQLTNPGGDPVMHESAGWNQIPTHESVTPDGEHLAGTDGHDYLKSGSRAEYNFAAVLAGQPDNTAWDDPVP
jgi:Alpha/beta hydrolase